MRTLLLRSLSLMASAVLLWSVPSQAECWSVYQVRLIPTDGKAIGVPVNLSEAAEAFALLPVRATKTSTGEVNVLKVVAHLVEGRVRLQLFPIVGWVPPVSKRFPIGEWATKEPKALATYTIEPGMAARVREGDQFGLPHLQAVAARRIGGFGVEGGCMECTDCEEVAPQDWNCFILTCCPSCGNCVECGECGRVCKRCPQGHTRPFVF